MKSQHPSSTPGGRGGYGSTGSARGNPHHLEYRPKGAQQDVPHPNMAPPSPDSMDVNAPVFKQGGGFILQHTARPFNTPMGYTPMGNQPGITQPMRGPPGGHHHHQPRMRGPPRGALHQQQYLPRGAMNQTYYAPQMQIPPPYMMAHGQYMGGPPMYGMPPMQDMSMGMGAMPTTPQPQHQPPPKRELKRLDIVDPKTGKSIVLGRSSSSERSNSVVEDVKAALSSATTDQDKKIAIEKEIAVTADDEPIVPPSSSKSPQKVQGNTAVVTNSTDSHLEAKASELTVSKELQNTEKALKSVESKSETMTTSSLVKTVTTTTSTTTTIEISSPKTTQTFVKESIKEETVKQVKSISPKKKEAAQDAVPKTLQNKAIDVEESDQVITDATDKVTSPIRKTNNVTSVKNSTGKVTYTMEVLISFRNQYMELPVAASASDSKWPTMEITTEVAVSRGGSRGGRNGAGWERGEKQSGGSGRPPRSGSGGGQWARSQDVPKRSGRGERGGRGGRGTRGGPPDPPLLDGPVKPLSRSANRWIPTKNASTLEVTKKNVNSIMNKMTREKFTRLAGQLTSLNMESLEMLQAVIKIIFDKAVSEPSFCDMYADLCVHLESNWKVWSYIKIVQNDDDKRFYWTAMSGSDSEVVGPFDDVASTLESAGGDEFEPVPAPSNMKLSEVRVRDHKFIKVWVDENITEPQYYWSGQDLDDLGDDQVLNGPFENHESASRFAIKTCSFKRILLNACQEEFEKDNIYEELENNFKKDKIEGKITPQMEADYNEKRLLMKLRMLGNIRFIGELYRKGMLQERIMHECIMKLMAVRLNNDGILVCVHPDNPPDEESIESLAKLLTTMGKDLDNNGAEGCMPSYFAYLENKLVKDKRLSSRITFMIKDVIELRQHRWEPRRKELKQKTLNEIRKEAEREARAAPNSAPSGGSRDRGEFRSDRRSNSSRDSFSNSRSTAAPVYHSQSMSSRSNNRQMPLPRGFGARDESVKTGPSGRPAAFGVSARQTGRSGASGSPASFPNTRRGLSTGAKKPQSPAPRSKEIPPLDDEAQEMISKKAKSIAEEYVSIVDLKEAETCLTEIQKEFKNHEDVDRVFAYEALKEAIDAKVEAREKIMDLIEKLSVVKATLAFVGVRFAIKKMVAACADLWCDVPMLHEHMSEFIVRFMKDSAQTGVTMEWALGNCLQSLDKNTLEELVEGGFLTAYLGEILRRLKTHDADKAKKELSRTNVMILSIFPSYKQAPKDMQDWIKKYDIDDVLPLEPAFGLVECASSAASFKEVISFVEKNIPKGMLNDPLFATFACLFILNLTKEGDLPSTDQCMLLVGLGGSIDTQVGLVSAIIQTRSDKDEVKRLLKHLVKEGAVRAPAITKWIELMSDNSRSRKRVQEDLVEFLEELARSK